MQLLNINIEVKCLKHNYYYYANVNLSKCINTKMLIILTNYYKQLFISTIYTFNTFNTRYTTLFNNLLHMQLIYI